MYKLANLRNAFSMDLMKAPWMCRLRWHLTAALVGLVSVISLAMGVSQAQVVVYTYDQGSANQIGRLSSVVDAQSSTSFEYDIRGNPTKETRTINGNTYILRRTYDSLNRVVDVTYPDSPTNEVVHYSYNAQGLLQSVRSTTYSLNYMSLTYNASSQILSKTLGNGLVTSYDYFDNISKGPITFLLRNLSTPGLQNLSYSYDAVGNVRSITDGIGIASQSFQYDSLNRLVTASSLAPPAYSHSYQYDPAGNMQSGAGTTFTYPAAGAVRYHAPTSDGSASYQYDANGNLYQKTVGSSAYSFAWDAENRLTSVTSGTTVLATFGYDHLGRRIYKTSGPVGAQQTATYVGDEYECLTTTSTTCQKYIFAGSNRIAMRPVGSDPLEVYYYQSDHLGSTTILTDRCGTKIRDISYYPYGSKRTELSFSGCTTLTNSNPVSQFFTGQYLDSETGLYDYGARYYGASFMHFISPDSMGVTLRHPQSLNRYSYVQNNPLRYIDPTGHDAVVPSFSVPPVSMTSINIPFMGGSFGSFGGTGVQGSPISINFGGGGGGGSSVYPFRGDANHLLAAVFAPECEGCTASDGDLFPGARYSYMPPILAAEGIVAEEGASFLQRILNFFRGGSASGAVKGFSLAESEVIREADRILRSSELDVIRDAYRAGQSASVKIGDRLILYEPGLPASGISLFGENGFVIGPEAFASQGELGKTVLHELYRLATTSSAGGVYGELVARETAAAASFAERAIRALLP